MIKEIEIEIDGIELDVQFEIQTEVRQSMEEEAVPFQIDVISVRLRGHQPDIADWLSVRAMTAVENEALEVLLDSTF